jgi:tRNA threonylcarbamoyladenosine biosynthesis protein TsaE
MTVLPMSLLGAAETEAVGAALAGCVRVGDVIALFGDLGAGKTTLARGLIRGLGFDGDVPSPTFPIVIAYDPPDVSIPFTHADLYRIEDPEDVEELGLDDARAHGVLLIEWPERLGARLWPDVLVLRIERDGDDRRRLTWEIPAAWEGRWPPR